MLPTTGSGHIGNNMGCQAPHCCLCITCGVQQNGQCLVTGFHWGEGGPGDGGTNEGLPEHRWQWLSSSM